jgi:hypothetical protein
LTHKTVLVMLGILMLTAIVARSTRNQQLINWTPLADLTYVSGGGPHRLKLLQEQPPVSVALGQGHCLLRKLEQTGENGTHVLWTSCEAYSPYSAPHPVWSGALAWNEKEKAVYLLLSESISINTRLHIYKVAPNDVGLDIKYDATDTPSTDLYVVYRKPFAHYKKTFPINDDNFIVTSANMQINFDVVSIGLILQCRRKGDRNPRHVTTCPGPNIHFSLGKKEWAEVK